MTITASLVKELRERTGAGMMECKKALVDSNGDMDDAIELMRTSGLAKADKKASRIAAEGVVRVLVSEDKKAGVLLEINSETDFVAKADDFNAFCDMVITRILVAKPKDIDTLMVLSVEEGGAQSINEARQELIAKIGENISVRRFEFFETATGSIGSYTHSGRIGVLVELSAANDELIKDICMHVAATNPVAKTESDVPADIIVKERAIFQAQAEESGKPEAIVEKMVNGRVKKYLAEITLDQQQFIKDPDVKVGELLKKSSAEVKKFVRFEVGQGIEKKVENFAEEVMAQAQGG